MKLTKKLSRRTLISTAAIVVLAAGTALAFWYQGDEPATTPSDAELVQEEQVTNSDDQPAEDFVTDDNEDEETGQNPEPTGPKQIVASDGGDTGADIEKPRVTRAEQSGSDIRVAAIFNSTSSGKCRLTLEKSGQSDITQTVEIIVAPSYYACNGFRVPVSELPTKGDWRATVTHLAHGQSVSSDPRVIEVQ